MKNVFLNKTMNDGYCGLVADEGFLEEGFLEIRCM